MAVPYFAYTFTSCWTIESFLLLAIMLQALINFHLQVFCMDIISLDKYRREIVDHNINIFSVTRNWHTFLNDNTIGIPTNNDWGFQWRLGCLLSSPASSHCPPHCYAVNHPMEKAVVINILSEQQVMRNWGLLAWVGNRFSALVEPWHNYNHMWQLGCSLKRDLDSDSPN